MIKRIIRIVAVGCACPLLRAQEEAYFHIEFEHSVIVPGESQTITVSASFAPPVNGLAIWDTHGGIGQFGHVLCLNDSYFNLVNVLNASTGVYSSPATNMSIYSFPGIPSGGNVRMISVGQFEDIEYANPVWLWRATWTPVSYTPREVILRTEAIQPIDIFLSLGLAFPVRDAWTTFDDEAGFQIVPAPAASVPLVICALVVARRRRITPALDPAAFRAVVRHGRPARGLCR